jgi:hypothetical protein
MESNKIFWAAFHDELQKNAGFESALAKAKEMGSKAVTAAKSVGAKVKEKWHAASPTAKGVAVGAGTGIGAGGLYAALRKKSKKEEE